MAQVGGRGGAQATVDTSTDANGSPVVRIGGELDISNAEELGAAIEAVVAQAPSTLVFDVTDLHFMDSSGIALMLQVAARVGEVKLRNPTNIVRRVVVNTGLSDVLHIES
jgi:anti-anti-sigma factor